MLISDYLNFTKHPVYGFVGTLHLYGFCFNVEFFQVRRLIHYTFSLFLIVAISLVSLLPCEPSTHIILNSNLCLVYCILVFIFVFVLCYSVFKSMPRLSNVHFVTVFPVHSTVTVPISITSLLVLINTLPPYFFIFRRWFTN